MQITIDMVYLPVWVFSELSMPCSYIQLFQSFAWCTENLNHELLKE